SSNPRARATPATPIFCTGHGCVRTSSPQTPFQPAQRHPPPLAADSHLLIQVSQEASCQVLGA
ncbi:hypothetical protein EMPG_09930, partial [Blastomyces silverae]